MATSWLLDYTCLVRQTYVDDGQECALYCKCFAELLHVEVFLCCLIMRSTSNSKSSQSPMISNLSPSSSSCKIEHQCSCLPFHIDLYTHLKYYNRSFVSSMMHVIGLYCQNCSWTLRYGIRDVACDALRLGRSQYPPISSLLSNSDWFSKLKGSGSNTDRWL